jgi:hypothetical protein
VNLRDADLRFLLPEPPQSVALLDAPPAAAEAWRAAGVEIVQAQGSARPHLVVAPRPRLEDALQRQPEMLVVYGRVSRRRLATAGYRAAHLLALPSPHGPRLVLPLTSGRAIDSALSRVGQRRLSRSAARRSAGRLLLRSGWAPPGATVTVAARSAPRPWLMGHLDADTRDAVRTDWYLWLGEGDPLQRAVLHIPTSSGGYAIKFSRVAGNAAPFRNEARASQAAAQLPRELARHVPRIYRSSSDGQLPFVVETRFAGRPLTEVLQGNWPVQRRLAQVERVAGWLHEIAIATRTSPTALASERQRLTSLVASFLPHAHSGSEISSSIDRVPGVLVHNDPGSWNVVVDRRGHFGIVDWESSRDVGMPLWDLSYFLADALTLVELRRFNERTDAILRLFRGDSPHSPKLFAHVRQAVADLSLEPDAVGPLVTLGWLHHAQSPAHRRERLRTAGAEEDTDRGVLSSIARPWLCDPALGFGWRAWR